MKKSKLPISYIPLEEEEQKAFVEYLELRNLKFTAIPNSTYTTSWNQKRKNKAMGLRAGFPDMVIILKNKLLFCELKRVKGSVISQEQKSWIKALSQVENVKASICYGAKEAIDFVEKELKNKKWKII